MPENELILKFKDLCCAGIEVPEDQSRWPQSLLTEYTCFCAGYAEGRRVGSGKEVALLKEARAIILKDAIQPLSRHASWLERSYQAIFGK